MKEAFFEIAEQVDNYGFFGKIEIEFEINDDYQKQNLQLDAFYEQWRLGVTMGISIFLEYCTEKTGVSVKVKNVEYNDIDTTNIIIAYITYQALCKGTGLRQRQKLGFDRQLKSFTLPR